MLDSGLDDVRLDADKLVTIKLPESRIFNILDYPTYEIDIDFNNPKAAAEKMTELVDTVEKECPVGKAFFDDVMVNNTAYEEHDKIWFDRENKFTNEFKKELKSHFNELRVDNPNGINYIKFNLEE